MQFFTAVVALIACTGVFAAPAPTEATKTTLEPRQFGGWGPAGAVAQAANVATLGAFGGGFGGPFGWGGW
ncbi:hypothetical protein PTTG_01364 [Puccinia triticina 1-1 BBBD Race 1]|uniref:Uncharacterized protein n=2 Tax=Puccinia triticina TaxID=208348 RepID=A0A0C4EKT6_PUCT1|nr:uncharacterized protein PtA15_14A420 [Puccinia triticina]OAV89922.1 hypothetical protein PTTG_01364 [Puccinia triticina 1-1 BBBD Race 1]WAQ91536.1 hypothetical protein PtA15_14A420 [Puccinia triticina]WAR62338.1 hypothetical protein PtB15_14B433 [Puccinia triticina]BAN63404.1 germinated spore protein 1 [Puccinia triticina]